MSFCRAKFLFSVLPALSISSLLVEGAPAFSVGALPGEVVVDNLGSSNYAIPIAVAPGTAGLVPDVSLVYSSQSGNGPMGVGWSIGGLSAISRGPKTYSNDSAPAGVQFNNREDRFYLDGQRLILVGGTQGAVNAEYRTELDQFSRIRKTAANTWTVETKDGLKMTYGSVENAQVKVAGTTNVISWSLYTIEDTAGNYIKYYYDNSSGTNGKNRISRIVYTGNTGQSLTPYASVEFEYETSNRPDLIKGYAFGGAFASEQRLKNIVIYTDGNYGTIATPTLGKYVRHYHLSYTTSDVTSRSLLQSVQVFAGGTSYSADGSTALEKLPETKFTYSESALSNPVYLGGNYGFLRENESGLVQGSGLNRYDRNATSIAQTSDETKIRNFIEAFGDTSQSIVRVEMDGDELPEIASIDTEAPGGVEIFNVLEHISSSGKKSYYIEKEDSGTFSGLPGGDREFAVGDFNGDQLSDLIFWSTDSGGDSTWKVHYGKYDEVNDERSFSSTADKTFNLDSTYTAVEVRDLIVSDLNADGLEDAVFIVSNDSGSEYEIWRNDAPFNQNASRVKDFTEPKFGALFSSGRVRLGDVNADGLVDLFVAYKYDSNGVNENYLCLEIFKGSAAGFSSSSHSFFNTGISLATAEIEANYSFITGDVNGDRATDIIVRTHQTSGSKSYIYKTFHSNGSFSTTFATNPNRSSSFTLDADGYVANKTPLDYVVDINGDTYGDLVIERPSSSSTHRVEIRVSDGSGYSAGEDFFYQSGLNFGPPRFRYSIKNNLQKNFVDLQGNGRFQLFLNFAVVQAASGDDFGIKEARVQFVGFEEAQSDLLTKVQSGYRDATYSGLTTNISYEPITEDSIYVKGSGAAYPIIDYEGPLYVVSEVEKDNGFGPDYSTLYTYADARVHVKGRGFLGFRVFESYDEQRKTAQKQILAQDWPFTGMQISVENYYDDRAATPQEQLLSQVRNALAVDVVDETGTTGAVNDGHTWFPFILHSEEKIFSPGSSNYHSKTKTTSIFDDYTESTIPNSTKKQYLDYSDIDDGASWSDEFLTQTGGSKLDPDPTGILGNLDRNITLWQSGQDHYHLRRQHR